MTQIPEDEPLDPKVEAIRKKMVRLLGVSGGIMAIGLMTVLAAIVYRVNRADPETVQAASAVVAFPKEGAIALPEGAQILDTALDGGRIMVTVRTASGGRAILIYRGDGGLESTIAVK